MNRAMRHRMQGFLRLGSISGVVNQMRPPVQSDFGGGGLQSPIYVNGVTGECFIYVNGIISPINTVNVKASGAKGDGVTNDTSAIVSAIAALPSGGVLLFPPGNYKVSGNLTLAVSGITITGPGATLSLIDNANNPVIIINASKCSVTNITIDGNRAHNNTPGFNPNAGILITGSDNLVLGCRLTNCQGGGIYSSTNARNRIAQNAFTGNSNTMALVVSSDNTVIGNESTGDDYGIFLYNNNNAGTPSLRNVVANNSVRNCIGTNTGLAQSAAISMAGAPDSIVTGNVCADNAFIRGIECFSGSTGSVIANNQVLRNGVTSGTSGIDTGPDNHLSITGNYVEANGGAGIFLSSNKYCLVANNICRNNGQNATARAAGGANGITMNEDSGIGTDPVTENIITGNHCIDTQGGGATQPFGIKQWQGLASYYLRNIISGNNVRTNASGDLSLLSVTDSVFGNVENANSGGDAAFLSDSAPMFRPYINITGNTTLTEANYRVTVDATSGNVTATLPPSPRVSREYVIRRTDSSGNTVTIAGNGNNINGAASITVAAVKGFRLFFNGGAWFTETT